MNKTKREYLAEMKSMMKGKSIVKMTPEFQKRYKEIKYDVERMNRGKDFVDEEGMDIASPVEVDPPKEKKSPLDMNPDRVSVDKIELSKILDRLDELEAEKKAATKGKVFSDKWEVEDEENKSLKATLRTKDIDGEEYYATSLKFVRKEFNRETREINLIYKVTWTGADEVEEEMSLPEFMSFARAEVVILNEKKEKLKKVTGKTKLVKVNYAKYKSESLGTVPMTVSAERISYDIELPSGKVLKNFPAEGLNR